MKPRQKKTRTALASGYHALLWEEGSWIVARCVELEVSSQGKTKQEAVRNLQEAIDLLLEDVPKPLPTLKGLELHTLSASYA